MTTQPIEAGARFSQTFTVQQSQTAKFLGSGNLEVFATPALIACMENTAMKLLGKFLDTESDSVGTEVCAKHLKASLPGETITIEAVIDSVDNRSVTFTITAHSSPDCCIGTATHTRFVINTAKFMSKLRQR